MPAVESESKSVASASSSGSMPGKRNHYKYVHRRRLCPRPCHKKRRKPSRWQEFSNSPRKPIVPISTTRHQRNGGNRSQPFWACDRDDELPEPEARSYRWPCAAKVRLYFTPHTLLSPPGSRLNRRSAHLIPLIRDHISARGRADQYIIRTAR